MGRPYSHIQTIFNRGELSPRIIGRVENKAYYNAVKYSQNLIPYPQGSITKRPGTYHVTPVKNSANDTILVEFRFSNVQNYVIEIGDEYMRFYRNRGQVESAPSTPYEISSPYPSSVLRELKFIQSYDTLFIFHKDYQTQSLTRTSDTSWTLSDFTYEDGPYLIENSTSTTLAASATTGSVTVTASAALFSSGDVGRQIRMKVGGTWGYGTITAYTDTTHVTMTVNKTLGGTGAVTTWRLSHFGGDMGWPGVGTIFEERFLPASTSRYPATIFGGVTGGFTTTTADMSPSSADGTVSDDSGFVITIGDDQVNYINWLSSGRILLIGTSGSVHSMSGGTSSTYAPVTPSNVTIKREDVNGTREFIRAHRIGSSVFYLSSTALKMRDIYYDFGIDNYISRDATIFNDHITKSGITDVCFQQEPDPNLWCTRGDGQLIGFCYDKVNEVEGWHRHILGGTDTAVKSVACIPNPNRTGDDIWMVVSRTIDGATVQYIEYMTEYFNSDNGTDSAFFVDSGLTYDGYADTTLTPGAVTGSGVIFTSGSAVFSASDVGNVLKSGTARATITAYNSATEVECTITSDFDSTSAIPSGSWSLAADSVSGLDHLEGEVVNIFADGFVCNPQTVTSGTVPLPTYCSRVHVGLGYVAYMVLLPVEAPELGTIQGRVSHIHNIHILLTDTMLLEYGCLGVDGQLDVVPTLQLNVSNYDEAPPLFNGILTRSPPSGYGQGDSLVLYQDGPTPLTVNYVVQEMSVNG
jgi:hypothetical protein